MARPLRVLLADDDRDNREMYSVYLGICGIEVVQAENGALAVERARRVRPDLIVMDLEMPVMGGLEAIEELKRDERTRSIPVIVLSANGIVAHGEVARSGCRACLVKPCMPQDLEGIIRSIAEPRPLERDSSCA